MDQPKLLYRPKSGNAAVMPLLTTLAAAADNQGGAGARAAASGTAAPAADSGFLAWFKGLLDSYPVLQRVLAALPPVAWIGLALLLLLAVLLVAWWKLRAPVTGPDPIIVRSPLPAPPAPFTEPSSPPSLAPTQVPGAGRVAAAQRHTRAAFQWPIPGSGQAIAVLAGISGSYSGRRFSVSRAATHIGYDNDNDLVLSGDEFVSGHHAIIKGEANSLYLVDLGSRNGSLLNGVTVTNATRALSPGDQLQFGQTVVQVLPADASGFGQGNGLEAQVP